MDATLKILSEIYNAVEHNLDRRISETSIAERLEKERPAEKRENVERHTRVATDRGDYFLANTSSTTGKQIGLDLLVIPC